MENPLQSIPKEKRPLVIIGGVALVVVVYAWWKNSTVAAEDIPADTTYDDGYVTQATPGDLGYSSGTSAGSDSGSSDYAGIPLLRTNADWTRYATEQLSAAGRDPATVQSALGKYLDRQPLTGAEQDVVRAALAAAGKPPEGSFVITPAIEAPAPSALSAPTGVKGTAAGSTAVNLTWNAVQGAGNYRVYRKGVSQNVAASYDNKAQIGGLQPNTSYTFYVAAGQAGTEKMGPRSSGVTVKTSGVSLAKPTGVKARATGKTTVAVSCTPVKGAVYYRWYANGRPSGASDRPTYTIVGLKPNTSYRITVAADTGNQKPGPQSSAVSVKTKR